MELIESFEYPFPFISKIILKPIVFKDLIVIYLRNYMY